MNSKFGTMTVAAIFAAGALVGTAGPAEATATKAKPRFAYGAQADPCRSARYALRTPSKWSNTKQVRWWYGDYCNRTIPPKHFRIKWCPTDGQLGFSKGALTKSQRCGMWWEGGEEDW